MSIIGVWVCSLPQVCGGRRHPVECHVCPVLPRVEAEPKSVHIGMQKGSGAGRSPSKEFNDFWSRQRDEPYGTN